MTTVIPNEPIHRLTLTVEEAAVALGSSHASAYEAVARSKIPCICSRIYTYKLMLVTNAGLNCPLEGAGTAT